MMRAGLWLGRHGFGLPICAIIKQGQCLVQVEHHELVGSTLLSSYIHLSFRSTVVPARQMSPMYKLCHQTEEAGHVLNTKIYIVIVRGKAVLLNINLN